MVIDKFGLKLYKVLNFVHYIDLNLSSARKKELLKMGLLVIYFGICLIFFLAFKAFGFSIAAAKSFVTLQILSICPLIFSAAK